MAVNFSTTLLEQNNVEVSISSPSVVVEETGNDAAERICAICREALNREDGIGHCPGGPLHQKCLRENEHIKCPGKIHPLHESCRIGMRAHNLKPICPECRAP